VHVLFADEGCKIARLLMPPPSTDHFHVNGRLNFLAAVREEHEETAGHDKSQGDPDPNSLAGLILKIAAKQCHAPCEKSHELQTWSAFVPDASLKFDLLDQRLHLN
jgi:hypothetical protein